MKKRIFGSILAGLMAISAMGQISNTLSPYSQFGLGVLADQSLSFSRGMSGLSIGVRDSKFPNVVNPASYSAVDSLTMLFDIGLSGQITNFKEGEVKKNARTADFDYAVASFRVLKKVGASFGVIPYSNIGYSFYNAQWIGSHESDYFGGIGDNYYNNTYKGSGGFSQAFLGLGWEFAKGFSVGANMSYFWGKYEKTVTSVFSDSYANTLTRTYSINVNNWKLDLGAQWSGDITKNDRLTLGAIVGFGHKLGADARMSISNTNSNTNVSSTTTDSVANGLSLPYSFGFGATVVHKNSLTVGADYQLQKWGSLDFPAVNNATKHYEATSGILCDRHKITVGFDWIPDAMNRKFLKRVHYRMGASYATPYYKIGTQDGPKELTLSAGFGFPIVNTWNNRTSLNISAQWVHNSAKNMLTENTFRINIGLTFNERWFAKWKVD
jgi:hypothetical protein